jgi:O-acetyl-ADP-ribose deacetylase (regulator of RNase III)
MIKIVQGDVTKASENIIIHQVNCQGKMGSGVAKGIRSSFPKVYDEYMKMCEWAKEKERLLGHAQVVQVGDNKYIVNLFSQLFYGYDGKRYTSYDALYDGFSYIAEHAKRTNKSVAMPYLIGCGLGGGDWGIVYRIIEQIFGDYEVTLYQYEEAK